MSCGTCNSPVPPPVCLPVNFLSKNVTHSRFNATHVAHMKGENLAFSELILNRVNKKSFLWKDQNLARVAWLLVTLFCIFEVWLNWAEVTINKAWNRIYWWADNCICYNWYQSVFLRMCPLGDPSLRYLDSIYLCKTAWFHLQGFNVLRAGLCC